MDDKAKIKALKILLGLSAVTTTWDLFVIWSQYRTIKKLSAKLDEGHEALVDLGFVTKKILDLADLTPEQIAEINQSYDFKKWQESLDQG